MNQELRPGPPRCRVVAGGTITTYQVVGRGGVVLVLTPAEGVRRRLVASLSPTARVVAPDLPLSNDVDPTEWLSAFVEALGISNVRVLADPAYEHPAHVLALDDPGRVATVIAIRDLGFDTED